MNLIEWLKATLDGFFLVRNIIWIISGTFIILGLFSFKIKFLKIIKSLVLIGIGISFFYLTTLMKNEEITNKYNENIILFNSSNTNDLNLISKNVNQKYNEFNSKSIANEKEVKEIKNDFFYKLSQVDYCSDEESKEIIEELNKMTEDDLKVTKIKSITLKNKEK